MYSKINVFFKVLLSVIFLGIIAIILSCLFFIKKDARFKIAEDLQGTYLSQYMFNMLKKENPYDSNIYHEQSVAFNKMGMYFEGFKLLNKAVGINSKEHLGYRGWMKLCKLKDYKGAISDFEQLNKISPKYARIIPGESINYLLAISYQGLNNYEKSKKYYDFFFKESDISLLRNMPYVYVNYGILLEKNGSQSDALAQYDKSLKIGYYKFSESYYNKGIVFEKMGLKDSAKICFEKALTQYDKGFRVKDIYNEAFNELYREDIIEKQKKILTKE